MFSLLLGGLSVFNTLETHQDSGDARRPEMPSQIIQYPHILPAVLHVISTAALMSTNEGLFKLLTLKAFVRGELCHLTVNWLMTK
jgi:hypothetical protein